MNSKASPPRCLFNPRTLVLKKISPKHHEHQAVLAVFKRNLVPTSVPPKDMYLSVPSFFPRIGAFSPQEFLDPTANLDHLNVSSRISCWFIPAITMSISADERRQGTDEPLTLPGSDFDVVVGKYLGAVAIFSVSLLISLVANYFVLSRLAIPISAYCIPYIGHRLWGLP